MSREFYVAIVSNSRDSRNESGHFFNKLSSPISLENNKWELGIKKLIYLNSFLNILDEKIRVTAWREHTEIINKVNSNIIKMSDANVMLSVYDMSDKNINGKVNLQMWVNARATKFQAPETVQIEVFFDIASTKKIDTVGEQSIDTDGKFISVKKFVYDQSIHHDHTEFTFSFSKYKIAFLKRIKIFCRYLKQYTYDIPRGRYDSINSVLTSIPYIQDVKFKLINEHVLIQTTPNNILRIDLLNQLHFTLGFNSSILNFAANESLKKGEHLPQLNRGRFAFFIYCNLCDYMNVGDSEVKLLDVISIPKSEFATAVSIDVLNPMYRPVCVNHINEIEIQLSSDSGELMLFDNSQGNAKTLIVLHFRQK